MAIRWAISINWTIRILPSLASLTNTLIITNFSGFKFLESAFALAFYNNKFNIILTLFSEYLPFVNPNLIAA